MNKIKKLLFSDYGSSLGLLILRVGFGIGIITHGQGKVFGGMEGFTSNVARQGFPAPELFAWAAALSEFAGGILLVLGLLTRPAAFFILCTMVGAFFVVHGDDPFSKKELAYTYMIAMAALLAAGGGRYSVDRFLRGK